VVSADCSASTEYVFDTSGGQRDDGPAVEQLVRDAETIAFAVLRDAGVDGRRARRHVREPSS
jgi:hypothetical protein